MLKKLSMQHYQNIESARNVIVSDHLNIDITSLLFLQQQPQMRLKPGFELSKKSWGGSERNPVADVK